MPTFSKRSKDNLAEADPRLQLLFNEVINHIDIVIICGHRGFIEQEKAYKAGKSKAHFGQSPHNFKPSYAVDVCPYPINWRAVKRFQEMGRVVKKISNQIGIEITWGGDWKSLKDYPHFEIYSWQTEEANKKLVLEEKKKKEQEQNAKKNYRFWRVFLEFIKSLFKKEKI